MSRLIDADALKDRLQALAYDDWNQGANTSWADAYREVAEMVEEQPTIDAVPERKKGRWMTDVAFYDEEGCPCIVTRCDQCGEVAEMTTYCPNCGARMEGAEDV